MLILDILLGLFLLSDSTERAVAAPIAQGLLSCGAGEVVILLPWPLISPNSSSGTKEIKKRLILGHLLWIHIAEQHEGDETWLSGNVQI